MRDPLLHRESEWLFSDPVPVSAYILAAAVLLVIVAGVWWR